MSSITRFSTGNKTTRGRRRLFKTSFEFEPCVMPAPSAKIFSNSGVAPPVIKAIKLKTKTNLKQNQIHFELPRKIVNAFSLK